MHLSNAATTFLILLLLPACSAPRAAAPAAQVAPVTGDAPAGSLAGPVSKGQSRVEPVVGRRGMVVADDRIAAGIGAETLRHGGNAIDAAVATAFAMSVTRPHYASLGGGGFMVYCPAPDARGAKPGDASGGAKPCEALDYRERAPGAATRDMFVRDGKAVPELSQDGALASGVPGVPAGLLFALERWGKLPRRAALVRAIELARGGIDVSGNTEYAAAVRWKELNPEARRIFGCAGPGQATPAEPCAVGARLRQPELARVLEAISREGAPGFYGGWVARKLVAGIREAGGILTERDLEDYRPRLREPLHGSFAGMDIVAMPPPSAGGGLLLELLGFTERADRAGALADGYGSSRAVHALAHAMALAFADRAELFGDPDFVEVPLARVLAPEYLDARWATFRSAAAAIPKGAGIASAPADSHLETTHFSVIDAEGNAAAVTTTVNDYFGSGFVPPGTGVVMNDEMDDFSARPGAPNLFGLVGSAANAIAPGKRPLSSMTPTIVRDREGRVRIVIGAAGGPRITTAVFLSLVNRLRFGMSLPDAVAAPRFHEQWKPEELKLERFGFSFETRERLESLGYRVGFAPALARVHALERLPDGRTWGVPDTRAEGAAVAE
jgi:gamma-glutamyltranspeptidase/glutathione hydrolase